MAGKMQAAAKPKAGEGGQPVLLAGGNPQIAKGHGDAPRRCENGNEDIAR